MTAVSIGAIVLAGLGGLRMLGQRQEPHAPSGTHDGDTPAVGAGAGRTPYDWAVDTLPFAEWWAAR